MERVEEVHGHVQGVGFGVERLKVAPLLLFLPPRTPCPPAPRSCLPGAPGTTGVLRPLGLSVWASMGVKSEISGICRHPRPSSQTGLQGEVVLGAGFCKTGSTGAVRLVPKEQLPAPPPPFRGEGHGQSQGLKSRDSTYSLSVGQFLPWQPAPQHFSENSLFRTRCVHVLGHLASGFPRALAQMQEKMFWVSAERAILA